MTDFGDPGSAALRLSNRERDEAVAQLNANLREGRIDEQEFTSRSAVVRSAVTRGDLAPVFSDLPRHPSAAGPTPPPPGAPTPPGTPPFAPVGPPPGAPPSPGEGRKGPLGGTAGTVAVSITPLVALILFFLTGALISWNYAWLWFVLVPLVYIIVYGAGTRDRPGGGR